jgi:hypothetical protein
MAAMQNTYLAYLLVAVTNEPLQLELWNFVWWLVINILWLQYVNSYIYAQFCQYIWQINVVGICTSGNCAYTWVKCVIINL